MADVGAHKFPNFILAFFFLIVFEFRTIEPARVFCFICSRRVSL